MFFELSVLAGLLVAAYFTFDFFYLNKKRKLQGKLVRIFLFEQVGKEKIFMRFIKGIVKEDEKIGIYITIDKDKRAISSIKSSDFFPDKEYGKCLLLCKYAEDDFRPIPRMGATEEWFKKVDLPKEEYLELEESQDEEGQESELKLKTDEDGNYIHKVDEFGEPVPTYTLDKYDEPLGVSQTSREAMRFNRTHSARMRELRGEKTSFWDKWGSIILTTTIVMLLFVTIAYNTNKTTEAQKYIADTFGEKANQLVNQNKDPIFIQGIIDKYVDKKDKAVPPSR